VKDAHTALIAIYPKEPICGPCGVVDGKRPIPYQADT
jgi:hypothetical protein